MENLDNIAKNSLEALSKDNLTEKGKRKLKREIIGGAIALVCLLAGLLVSWIFPTKTTIPALFYTIGFLIEGIPVMFVAIKGVFTRNLENAMEMLVVIAIVACYFSGDLILAVLIPLILNIAHILEERSIMGGRDVIDGLRRMQQNTAILLDGNEEKTVDAKTLKVGQRILVKPGAGIPIDGVVISGETNIDQKSLTGEPQPAHAVVGDTVYAGTVNIDGRIVVEVKKEYVDTSFSNIISLLEKSENISIPETRIIDRFMKYYIPFVLAISAGVALITSDITKAIAILVVSCPCGQMLVSSAPMIAALSAATKRGILIKNSKFIEELTDIDVVVFDKTGTVTVGDLSLTDAVTAEGVSREELMGAAANVASASAHPISRALMASIGDVEYSKDYKVTEISGKGMDGTSPDGKHNVKFGNADWISSFGVQTLDSEGVVGSISHVLCDGKMLGYLVFNDTARKEAKEGIDTLKNMGIEKTVMLTGDRREAAEKICTEIGIDTLEAQLLPEDKLESLKALKETNYVLAVGDGINDALALKEAHVGIAMGAMGSELAIQSADIALMNNNLLNIPFSIRLARRTKKIIYQNLALSIGISALMIGLSAFGVISALAGSILHNVGAFAVLINSSRILKTQ
ncbi:MAG: cadmium-translocating P-type ATPase [Ruminococcaceae bacterium]|nr:cadmium-translocating P-type ATPase [Oscillospiraceae bacterium]